MSEYNAENEKLKKQYEEALLHGKYREKRTVYGVWKSLNLFEQFTGKSSFSTFNAEQAKGFKRWLEKQENAKGEKLSVSTVRSTLSNIREFFLWLAIHPQYVRKVDGRAANFLHLSNNDNRAARASIERPAPKLKDTIDALEAMPYEMDIQKRDRAIFALVCATGIRDAALISLKIKDINLETGVVWQNPKHVKTKNRKGIQSKLMDIVPNSKEIVLDWVRYCKEELKHGQECPLFPSTLVKNNLEKLQFESSGLSKQPWANAQPVRNIFKEAFERVGINYHNPHSFRKMLVNWGMKNCSQYEFKAISQNLGHEHCMTTYNSYGNILPEDQFSAIENMTQSKADLKSVPMEEILAEVARRSSK